MGSASQAYPAAIAAFLLSCTLAEAYISPRIHHGSNWRGRSPKPLYASTMTNAASGSRIPINEDYPGLKRVHTNPDVFVIEQFLDDATCEDLISKAKEKGLVTPNSKLIVDRGKEDACDKQAQDSWCQNQKKPFQVSKSFGLISIL